MKEWFYNKFLPWIKAAGIRALKTMAQTALPLIPVAVRIDEVDWVTVVAVSASAGVISLLTSLAGLPELKGREGNA